VETQTPNFAKKTKHDVPVGRVVEVEIVVNRHCKKRPAERAFEKTWRGRKN
jgi:hypothetical protein